MKAAVLGVGRMGTAIVYAMNKLGFYVAGMDACEDAAYNFRKYIGGSDGAFYLTDQDNADRTMETALLHEKPDIVISSLPYHQTEDMGFWCIDNGFRYCDLGGRVDVSANINEYVSRVGAEYIMTKPVFTDLGLAPGWVNILAEQGYKKVPQTEKVSMYVGGLPSWVDMSNPLKYEATWSIDGLINEYVDDCEVLENGKLKEVKGMDGFEAVDVMGTKFEAFFTSGGAAHTIKSMKDRGVLHCYYKTLRYGGHNKLIKFLINKCELGRECLEKIFRKGCAPSGDGDIVLMKVLVSSGVNPSLTWKRELQVLGEEDGFSGMQKATAFPISSVAKIMAEGKMEGDKDQRRDHWTQYPKALSYADIPFDDFNKNLELLGIYDEIT